MQVVGSSWEKQPNESDVWFSRFDKYAKPLGHEFTVQRAFNLYAFDMSRANIPVQSNVVQIWASMALQYEWKARAGDWDDDESFRRRREWEQRRRDLADADWGTGGKLRDVATKYIEALEQYKVVGQTPDGRQIVQVNLRPGELSQLLKISSDLQRLAVGEPTEISGRNDNIGPAVYLPEMDGGGNCESKPRKDTQSKNDEVQGTGNCGQ
jgi:hypothetical protein